MSNYRLKVNPNNRNSTGIDEYFADAEWLWRRDTNERSVFDLWLHVIDHCTRLVEAVRKERPKEVMDDLADTTMWMFSFLAQLHRSNTPIDTLFRLTAAPSDIIWNKYPGRCPACFDFEIAQMLRATSSDEATRLIRERQDEIMHTLADQARQPEIVKTCNCLSRISFAEERHKIYKAISWDIDKLRLHYAGLTRRRHKVSAFADFERMFETIFINAYFVFSIQVVAFHLLEEVGEVTQGLKDCYTFDMDREPFSDDVLLRRRLKLEEEIADVFSWLFALMLKIKHVYYQDAQEYFQTLQPPDAAYHIQFDFIKKVSLGEIIWAKYGRRKDGTTNDSLICTGCFAAPCACRRDLKVIWGHLHSGESNPTPASSGLDKPRC